MFARDAALLEHAVARGALDHNAVAETARRLVLAETVERRRTALREP
jgi:hypothetical protein